MDYAEHTSAVERETAAIVEALAVVSLDEPVPTCPDWQVRDLVKHLGEFTIFWAHLLCEGTGRAKPPYAEHPEGGGVAEWYDGLARSLVTELRATPPDTTVWTWVPSETSARFTARRCANELAVHRFDVECAAGRPRPIAADLAADTVEEIFVMIPAWESEHEGSGRSLHVCASDSGHEWTITLGPGGPEVVREHTDAGLSLSGAMSDLALTLFGRPALGPVDRQGDAAVLDGWYREFSFG